MVVNDGRESFYHSTYFRSLDGLRTLSIVPVVWHHATPYAYEGLLGRGPIGVDLFFAISGFLITTLLLRERHARHTIDLFAFYVRRACRIFPLYYLVLLLNFAYAIKVAPEALSSHNFLLKLPHFASYTANWFGGVGIVGPQLFAYAWSLCAEEQFYAFWAPLLRYSKRVSIAAAVMAIIVTLDLWLESSPSGNVASAVATCRTILTSFATPIGFGALLAWLSHHSAFGPKLIAAASPRWVAPLVLLVTASLVITPWAPLVVLHAMLAILVFVCAAQQRHGLSRFLDHPVMTFVGRVSYGIYLWHVAVIGGIKQLYPSLKNEPGWLFACAMPLSVLVAAVSYRFYERPFLRLSTRYRRRVSCDVGLASHGAQSAG